MQRHSAPGNSSWADILTLAPATGYNLRLVAMNSVGSSHPSRTVDLTTKEEVPEGPPTEVEASPSSSQSLVITWKVGLSLRPSLDFNLNSLRAAAL